MKKIIFFTKVVCLSLIVSLLFVGQNLVLAAGSNNVKDDWVLTPEQKKEVNQKLEELRLEINEELAKGKTNVSGAKELSFSERPVTFSFSVSYDEETEDFVTTAKKKKPAWKKKNFSAKVSYGGIGGFGGFWHKLYGDFKYRQGKVGNYYYNDDYGGPLYAKSSKKSSKRTDPSVVRVSTKGSFRALKYSPVEYTTNIEIGLYGSGTYQIHRAKIN